MKHIHGLIRSILQSRRLPFLLPILTILLCSHSLRLGLVIDDLSQRYTLLQGEGRTLPGAAFHVFRFIAGPEDLDRWREIGAVPWWVAPNLRMAFWRPVSSATQWLDYQLWPTMPVLMHVHSLLWSGLLVFLVAVLFRRLLPFSATAAGLAALLFAVDDSHFMPFAWIANRNSVIASVFGIACLLAHDRWRTAGDRRFRYYAIVLFALSLLSAEFGAGTGAYLLSYALFLDRVPRLAQKLGSIAGYLVVGAVWLLAYRAMGFGASGTSFYHDPASDPFAYVSSVFASAAILLCGQFIPVPVDMAPLASPAARDIITAVCAAFLLIALLLCRPVLKSSPHARFFAAGMVLSLLPVCATLPSDRLLLLAGTGGWGLFAMVVRHWVNVHRRNRASGRGRNWPSRLRLCVLGVLLLFNLPIAAIMLSARVATIEGIGRMSTGPALSLPEDAFREGQRLIALGSHGQFHFMLTPLILEMAGRPYPPALFNAFSGVTLTKVTRLDERTLHVEPEGGFLPPVGMLDGQPGPAFSLRYLMQVFDAVFRDHSLGFIPGETMTAAGIQARIETITEDGRPASVRFTFDKNLEDADYVWVTYREGRLDVIQPPRIGETRVFPAVALPSL